MKELILTTLRNARERIRDPRNHTTKQFARDAKGMSVDSRASNACSWCALGTMRAEANPMSKAYDNCITALSEASGNDSIIRVNDHRGHAATLDMFTRAIDLVEKDQVKF